MPSAGDKLGPYEILSPLGEGGMGVVWKARDTRLDRTVALKILKAGFGDRFEREARAVAALNHPNICQLYDVGPNFLVMELVDGVPLRGPLPVEKAIAYAGQILDGLDAAHKKGIVHRDLKPANILVTKQGIKLLDFGLAKQDAPLKGNDETLTQAMTAAGQIVGTLQYMAPEQLQGKTADARSDLFAFGCVLYEFLSGKRAFEGNNAASVIASILEREPAPLSMDPALGRVIKRCLAKDPDDRFQTARDLKYNLELAMERPPGAVAGKPKRWYWAVAAACMLLAGLAGWKLSRSRQAAVEGQAVHVEISPPEGGHFQNYSLAVSPDGRTLVFVATVDGKNALWLRPIDGRGPHALVGTEGAYLPFWSPDGKSIAYFGHDKLWRVDAEGGTPAEICEATAGRGGSWGSDGSILFSTALAGGLKRVSASGSSPADLTVVDQAREENAHYWPQVLSTGRFLYWVGSNRDENTGIYAATLDKPRQAVRLMATPSKAVYSAGHLLWLRGSTLVAQKFDAERLKLWGDPHAVADPVGGASGFGHMILAASPNGVLLYGSAGASTQFGWFDRTGKALGTVWEPGEYRSLGLSPDARRMAVGRVVNAATQLWMVELERNIASRFTFAPGENSMPVWSPDGRTVVFHSGFGGSGNLYRKDASGAGAEQRLTESRNPQWPIDWSRDSRFVLYEEEDPKSGFDLWVLPVTPDGRPVPGSRPRAYLRTRFTEVWGRFSPESNPRWIAYVSDESGRDEVYMQAFPEPRGKWRISTGGGSFPEWRADGRELFYVSPEYKLMAVSLKLGAESVEPSTPRELFGLPGDRYMYAHPYAVAPDGKRFLARKTIETGGQPLQVILNWPELLKKAAGME